MVKLIGSAVIIVRRVPASGGARSREHLAAAVGGRRDGEVRRPREIRIVPPITRPGAK